jgi:hypothetical protein
LLSSVNNTRTYVRLLRHLGVALIFAPEPFTTPFGVAFVLVARYLSKRHEASVDNHLRETFQYYLAHSSHFGDYVDGEAGTPGRAKPSGLLEGPPILGQITGGHNLNTRAAPSPRHSGRDARGHTSFHTMDTPSPSKRHKAGASDKVESARFDTSSRADDAIHHTIDAGWLSRRYESANGAVAHSSWATTSDGTERITHHSVNMRLFSRDCGTGTFGQAKAKRRAPNTGQRRQRGSAASHTTVVRAIKNNNHYYDALSRNNVIGDY